MNKCMYCINKEACADCDDMWRDKFIPSDDVKKYFKMGYNGVRGMNGYTWGFDSTSEDLVPTHSIRIYGSSYCPYCGERMLSIQNSLTLKTIGHYCICEGARTELEYEAKLTELKQKFEEECGDLKGEYSEKLKFDIEKLFSIKHSADISRTKGYNGNYLSLINESKIHNIEDM